MRIIVFLTFLLTLSLYCGFRVYIYHSGIDKSDNAENLPYVAGILLTHPYESEGFQVIKLGQYTARVSPYPVYYMGQYVRLIKPVSQKNTSSRVQKGYSNYLFFPKVENDNSQDIALLVKISIFRHKIIQRVQQKLAEPYSILLLGVTFGYKGEIPKEFEDLLINTGTIHILVVSGYNITLLIGFVGGVFARFGPKLFFIFSELVLILFTICVGFEPPIIRAFIMGTSTVIAYAIGDAKVAIYQLFLTALIMITVSPRLIGDLSFQLTFLATFGVLVSSMIQTYKIKNNRVLSDLALIVCVNLFVWPVISYNFERITLSGLIANLAVSWIIPIQTILGFVFIIFPIIPIKIIMIGFWDFFLFVLNATGNLDFLNISYKVNPPIILVYYAFLMSIVISLIKSTEKGVEE